MEKAHDSKELDLSGAARGVWLVKVPKYLSEKWKQTAATPGGSGEVGKLCISKPRMPGGKNEVIFSLNEALSKSGTVPAPGNEISDPPQRIPREHKFVLTKLASQSLAIMTQEQIAADPASGDSPNEKLAIEGKVIQRAECRPVGDAHYMSLKRKQLELSNKPKREVVQLKNVVQSYKPRTTTVYDREAELRRKEKGKNVRMERDQVQDILFGAFEKHQYYNIKDLQRITKQPIAYLKEILKELCTYNMKSPHRNMWELKPEYRHYKKDGE